MIRIRLSTKNFCYRHGRPDTAVKLNHLCQAAELHIFLNRFIHLPLEQTLKIERGQAGHICQFLRVNVFC